jgi:hypothetical protein
VAAFDFDFDHAFGFYPDTSRAKLLHARPCYELFADIGEESDGFSVERTAIAEAFARPRQKMIFLFDYGDMWLFRVELLGFGRMDAEAARIVGRQGRAPEQYPGEEELEYEDEDEDEDEKSWA